MRTDSFVLDGVFGEGGGVEGSVGLWDRVVVGEISSRETR